MAIKTRPRVAFVVNGTSTSAMAERAGSFSEFLSQRWDCQSVFRTGGKLGAAGRMLQTLVKLAPDVCYVLDVGASGVAAAGLYKHATGTPFVIDTGDAVVELGRVLGRGPLRTLATQAMETYAFRAASAIVVRGTYHCELLAQRGLRAEFIPDGVYVDRFAGAGPRENSVDRPLVIGLVGNTVWIPARQTCYGWELVELVRLLQGKLPRKVKGVLIGDGSGIDNLKRRAAECGVNHLIEFAGRVPYDGLPHWLGKFDICLSTQTNDVIGNVRTTGKLPLYLAAGRFVLASRVGEAARILPAEMLVDFAGETDVDYPEKLASRVEDLITRNTDFSFRPECEALARDNFEYASLALRVEKVLTPLVSRSANSRQPGVLNGHGASETREAVLR